MRRGVWESWPKHPESKCEIWFKHHEAKPSGVWTKFHTCLRGVWEPKQWDKPKNNDINLNTTRRSWVVFWLIKLFLLSKNDEMSEMNLSVFRFEWAESCMAETPLYSLNWKISSRVISGGEWCKEGNGSLICIRIILTLTWSLDISCIWFVIKVCKSYYNLEFFEELK